MKDILIASLMALVLAAPAAGLAQPMGMMGSQGIETDDHTAAEEAEGKALWQKLQAKETSCDQLSDEDFAALGEYFMGTMLGDAHPAMNAMMERMMGEEGEEQMHVVMGKRLSGCDTSAVFPAEARGFMPMMQMMFPLRQGFGGQGGGWSFPFDRSTNSMMWNFGSEPGGWFGLGLGWIFMVFWWLLAIAGIVFLVRWLVSQARGGGAGGKSALDILKERYARGEIRREEFEEKKRDIS